MRTLLTNLNLWDGTAASTRSGSAVLVDGERIVWAGAHADAPDGAPDEVVDARHGTLIPGLIDAHMHFAMRLTEPASDLVAPILERAAGALAVGITSARDLGAAHLGVIAAARELAAGRARGPRIIAAGRFIALPGGYGPGLAVEVSEPAAVRAAVKAQVAAGAGVIKVIASPVPPAPDPALPPSFGLDNLVAAAEAAHAAGLRVTAHAHSRAGARDAVLAGFDCMEHGYRLDAETIAEMARRNVWLVPTLVAMEAAQARQWGEGQPRQTVLRAHERWEAAVEAARAAHRAGIRLATGTDALAITPVDAVRREVQLLVEAAGLTPVEALRAATSAAADLLGIASETGRIEAGMRADLLLVDGDPLSDPAVLGRVRAIWRDGARVSPA